MSRRRAVDRGPRVDLHMHTVRSDGALEPDELLARAASGGLDVIAVTDHDLPPPVRSGLHRIEDRALRVIAGVELSTMHEENELHLLVYFPDQMPLEFADWCRDRARWRASWYDDVRDVLGLADVPAADADSRAGRRCLTRMHLARAMVASGRVSSLHQAFKHHIGVSAGKIPPLNMGFVEALGVARDAGGWTAWAHPDPKQADVLAPVFAAAGLHALETHRPAGGGRARNRMARLAHRHGLGMTGGSDWHGWNQRPLGSFAVPARTLWRTDEALGLLESGLAQA